MSALTIQFVKGGYVLHTSSDDADSTTEVFLSTAKLTKAVRAAIEELTLVPKKGDADEAAE